MPAKPLDACSVHPTPIAVSGNIDISISET
jgi:hypothetical protein